MSPQNSIINHILSEFVNLPDRKPTYLPFIFVTTIWNIISKCIYVQIVILFRLTVMALWWIKLKFIYYIIKQSLVYAFLSHTYVYSWRFITPLSWLSLCHSSSNAIILYIHIYIHICIIHAFIYLLLLMKS